jgi:hypothetical protein
LIDSDPRPIETGAQSTSDGRIQRRIQQGNRAMTSKHIFLAAITLIAAPAVAKGNEVSPKTDKASASEQKYCLSYEKATGSRLDRQECRTKRNWAKDGVDVDKMIKGED